MLGKTILLNVAKNEFVWLRLSCSLEFGSCSYFTVYYSFPISVQVVITLTLGKGLPGGPGVVGNYTD